MDAVFAIGSNGSGQLGIGHKEDVSVPKQALFHPAPPSSPVVKVAAGGNHTLLLCQAGELYWSGDHSTGACGLGPGLNAPGFQKVRLTRERERDGEGNNADADADADADGDIGPVALAAATWQASIIVARDDAGKRTRVFSFGIGTKGELGLGELIVRSPLAARVSDFPPPGTEVVDLSACMEHAVAVLDNGDAYGWGNCRRGQAGAPGAVLHAPRRIEGVGFRVARAVCAKEATCLLGEPESGSICVLGSDKWNLRSRAPSTVSPWTDVGASWGNFYVLNKDGSLVAWGRDDHGQLPPPELPTLARIAIGSEHVVALSEQGDVVAWGWGEHGNCGPQVEDNIVRGRWNVIASSKFIPPGCRINTVGAGCATSWICIQST
ncbi:RCC1 repeat-containing protein [Escovopsis weberi]|uniref:RCC1 repeat-containing protein n=1 Tax=Escovopsis weberi TaxID=150374 RepID=A0A0M8N686_ESCWE|nr:RCC1 repeat-containing protein [Escovopsis weberi]